MSICASAVDLEEAEGAERPTKIWEEAVDVVDAIEMFDAMLAVARIENLRIEELVIDKLPMRVRFTCDPFVNIPLSKSRLMGMSEEGYSYRFSVEGDDNVDFMEFATHVSRAARDFPEICSEQVRDFARSCT